MAGGFLGENRLNELLTLMKNKFLTSESLATANTAGIVKPDGTTTTVDANGVLSASGSSVPDGGTTGQALVKHSNTDQDVEWATVGGGSTYTAGDGININNNEISTKNMAAADMSEIIDVLPSRVSNFVKYSMDEQIVGEWIDGKPIYQKVWNNLNFSITAASQWSAPLSLGVTDIKDIIDVRFLRLSGSNTWMTYAVNEVVFENDALQVFGGYNTRTVQVLILTYTKTTD